jgi:hypothetical protein
MKVVIWLDDMRDPKGRAWKELVDTITPDVEHVIWAKTVAEFQEAFNQATMSAEDTLIGVFFDNDLGGKAEGRHAFNWMEEQVRTRNLPPFSLYAQTSNPAAKKELHLGFEVLDRFWESARDGGSHVR